ncbi:MAG: alpha/beta-type small acid-soluble spore protein [Acetobacteraceae bacterium]|nr:alpha/beta-type small acid-soluble spore protein [Acetobacteraceae bacterium]
MGRGQKRNTLLVGEAWQAVDQFKMEVANEVGVAPQIRNGYWGYISSRDCGAVGGNMVRRMIAEAERSLTQQGGTLPGTSGIGRAPEPGAGAPGGAGGAGGAGGGAGGGGGRSA